MKKNSKKKSTKNEKVKTFFSESPYRIDSFFFFLTTVSFKNTRAMRKKIDFIILIKTKNHKSFFRKKNWKKNEKVKTFFRISRKNILVLFFLNTVLFKNTRAMRQKIDFIILIKPENPNSFFLKKNRKKNEKVKTFFQNLHIESTLLFLFNHGIFQKHESNETKNIFHNSNKTWKS